MHACQIGDMLLRKLYAMSCTTRASIQHVQFPTTSSRPVVERELANPWVVYEHHNCKICQAHKRPSQLILKLDVQMAVLSQVLQDCKASSTGSVRNWQAAVLSATEPGNIPSIIPEAA